ncbi:alpha/beta hydrolase family protein [Pseudokineococcus sp. 1T1Z-3]|uniref:alpha/beta hydrolase family protein n=1 Tax=Pseudokineococcus sp. 1T1Z-3 TaxID=3132745 RepID=UPI0030B7EC5C
MGPRSVRGGPGAAALADPDGSSALHIYGQHPRQVAELHLPSRRRTDGVAVLVHGGFWRAGPPDGGRAYDRRLQDHVAVDLLRAGIPVWLVDYRAVGQGGGWPATLADAAAALDLLVAVAPAAGLDASRAVVVGHSAGGQVAAWSAGRHLLPEGAPGASPALRPLAVVAQAGVLDLVAAHAADLGRGAVAGLLGGSPREVEERYAHASPAALVPACAPVLAVTGDLDEVVPPDQGELYAQAARTAGATDVRVALVRGEGHSAHLDPTSQCWALTRAVVLAALQVR